MSYVIFLKLNYNKFFLQPMVNDLVSRKYMLFYSESIFGALKVVVNF